MPKTTTAPYIRVDLRPNRTASGRRTAAPGRQAARYIAYGQRATAASQLRGQWVDPAGKPCSQAEVMAWVREGAMSQPYTAHAVFSLPQGALEATDYCAALNQAGAVQGYRLMVHTDTAYNHAHALFFWEKRLDKETFLAWQATIREELSQREQQQVTGQAASLALAEATRQASGYSGSSEMAQPQTEAVGYGY